MKILPINNNLQSNRVHFNGLWGRSLVEFNADDSVSVIERLTDYHPFKNESKESITDVIQQYANARELAEANKVTKCYELINIRKALPFTQAEYLSYKDTIASSEPLTPLQQKVLSGLKKYNLDMYINESHRNLKPDILWNSLVRFITRFFK